MKVVLRHKKTGHYYHAPGEWVRRADNALTFENVHAAKEFCRQEHLLEVQAVQRLAPYLMSLMEDRPQSMRGDWSDLRTIHGRAEDMSRFLRN